MNDTIKNITKVYPSASTLPCNLVDELVDDFHSEVADIIDSNAPLKLKFVSVKMKSPWDSPPAVRKENSECRKVKVVKRLTPDSIRRDFKYILYN